MSIREIPQRYIGLVEDRSGSRSLGSFDIVGYAGEGAFGIVFVATERRDRYQRRSDKIEKERLFALKVFRDQHQSNANNEFKHEYELLHNLRHPNIIKAQAIGRCSGRNYLVFEYASGGSLAERIGTSPHPPHTAAGILQKVATAVAYAHGFGVIHRDLKPANILLTPAGEPKVSDFGTVKLAETLGSTGTGDFRGTLAYMAPEQLQNRPLPQSDIYSLGVTLYQALTGRLPIEGDGLSIAARVLAREPFPTPRSRNAEVPSALDAICMRCLSWEPSGRYPDGSALADDLGRFLRRG
jgi:serine/threonine protein kinase